MEKVKAKISKGEMVIPPEIVEYFGVAYFEKLRDKAKKAMGEMDQGGRINGGAPQDDLPFSDEELSVEDDDADVEMAAGGLVSGGNETKTYIGPNGQEVQIQFVNGQPVQEIPPGFVLKAGQTRSMQTQVDEGERPQNTIQQEVKPMNEWAPEDFEKFANQENVMKGFGTLGMLLGPGGALIGRGAMEGYRHSARKALEEIDTRLADSNLDQANKDRLQQIRGQLEDTAEGGLFGRMGNSMRSGNGLLGGLLPEGGLMGKLFKRDQPASTPTTTRAPTGGTGSSSAGLASRPTSSTSRAPTRSPATQSRPSSPQSTPSRNPDAGGGFDRGVGLGTGPMAEGGLIKKRK